MYRTNSSLFVHDPSRSSKVPFKILGEKAQGIVVCDRYSSYSKLAKMIPGILLAICWAHYRRDYIKAATKYKELSPWKDLWLERIGTIYALNEKRLQSLGDEKSFQEAQKELEDAIHAMKQTIEEEL